MIVVAHARPLRQTVDVFAPQLIGDLVELAQQVPNPGQSQKQATAKSECENDFGDPFSKTSAARLATAPLARPYF